MFWTKLAQKNCFPSKIWKMNTTIELFTFELVLVPHFSWNWQLKVFGPNLPKKGVSLLKQWRPQLKQVKTTIEFSIFWLLLLPNLNWNWQFWFFFVQLCLKWCFPSKTEKVDTAIEFCVFEFVLELVLCHWILRIRINFFDQIAQKGCLRSKIEKSHLCTRLWLVLTILNLSARGLTDTMFLLLRREKKAHG